MRVACVGGGPGGLFFSALLKSRLPEAEVVVLEQNPAEATYGFGVVFSKPTLLRLEQADPDVYAAIVAGGEAWDDIEIRRRGERLRVDGNGYVAIARKRLLQILQRRAQRVDVELRFEQDPVGLDDLRRGGWDLIVGSDGVNSGLRHRLEHELGPRIDTGRSMYIWFGTSQDFDALTFSFVENEHGAFGAHAYPFGEGQSTFIVETDPATWRRAGLDRPGWDALAPGESDELATSYCAELFADDLRGEPLLLNNSKWLRFANVSCRRWSSDEVVMLGDAVHTAHFSVGSGTKMAMEDGAALAALVPADGPVAAALDGYERERRARVDRTQFLALPSQVWWEEFSGYGQLSNEQFAFHFLTRSLAITGKDLESRAPRFMREHAAALRVAERLHEPLRLRGLEVPNAIAVDAPTGPPANKADEPPVEVAGVWTASFGAGLVFVKPTAADTPAGVQAQLRHVRGAGAGAVGVSVPAVSGDAAQRAAEIASSAAADVLELDPGLNLDGLVASLPGRADAEQDGDLSALIAAARLVWPRSKPLIVRLVVEGGSDLRPPDDLVDAADHLLSRGVDMLTLAATPGDGEARARVLLAADRMHSRSSLAVCVEGVVDNLDEAAAILLAGRADLCRGGPSLCGVVPAADQ